MIYLAKILIRAFEFSNVFYDFTWQTYVPFAITMLAHFPHSRYTSAKSR